MHRKFGVVTVPLNQLSAGDPKLPPLTEKTLALRLQITKKARPSLPACKQRGILAKSRAPRTLKEWLYEKKDLNSWIAVGGQLRKLSEAVNSEIQVAGL